MKKLYLFLVLFIIASACKKKNLTFKFSGKITSAYNHQPLSDVSINIYTKGLASSSKKISQTVLTDANGKYEMSISRDNYEKITLSVEKELYFNSNKTYNFDDLSTTESTVNNFSIQPKSWLLLTIQTSANDTLRIQKISGKTNCESCAPNKSYYFYNKSKTLSWLNNGGTYTSFHYWINQDSIHVLDSVYTPPFDTVQYLINY